MLLSQKGSEKLEEAVVEALHKKPYAGPTLLSLLRYKDPKLPKETFYRILRKLLKNEVVNKHDKIYQLNRHWLQRIYRFGRTHIETNQATDADHILSFKEGDKITYKFKNPNLMGIYWAHTYDMIFDKHDPKVPILIYHPHEWLVHTRIEAESFFLGRIEDDKKPVFFSIGGKTSLDMEFKKKWQSRYLQIATGVTYGLQNNEYVNVLGDFIFKVSMSRKFGNDLEEFFSKNSKIDQSNRALLEHICNRNDSAKMVFTRSKKEAAKWHAKFKKYFYKPKRER